MPEIKKSTCDLCLFNFACENVGDEDCLIPCLRKEDPLYKAFMMGYNKGLDDGYEECEASYELDDMEYESDEYGSYKLAIPVEVEEEGEEDAF